jgi:Glycosyltransferase family 87
VQAASLVVILWLTRSLLRGRLSERGWRFVCALTLSSVPVYWHFGFSQVQLLLAALVLGAYCWLQAGKHSVACLAVAAAGLLKLFPFLLLPWFVWRGGADLRGRLVRAAQAAAFMSVAVILSGPKLWRDFFEHGTSLISKQIINRVSNFTVPSLLINLGYAGHDFAPGTDAARGWWMTGLIVGAGLLVAAYWLCLHRDADAEAEFCLLCVAMLAGSVTSWGHYFVFLIFPMAAAAARLTVRPSGRGALTLALCFLALDNLGFVTLDPWRIRILETHLYWKILANHIPLYGLLGLGVFFVNELRRRARSPQPVR